MARYKLIIAYDGTNYNGFARQPNGTTIVETLEEAVEKIVQHKVYILGAGRTDTGVHAKGQCCIFDSDTKVPVERLAKAINSKLPMDIAVQSVEKVSGDFHPRFGAKRKTYRYQIMNSKQRDPFSYKYALAYPYEVDLEKMKAAAEKMVGTHDFKCFCAAKTDVKDTVRTIYDIQIYQQDDLISVDICGNGFLYNMVRIIIGTLLKVNEGKLLVQDITRIIESKDRNLAGPTAPPQGLTMLKIIYE
ncbi:tRNA pseudouridine(38-40) synthase TruA [Cellulosilyticum ruminicola]|uniref:tRNA pseudouridine(38-40) synthase TruA n=1 Tax=Cellulosilyticum ruminicola TaxID=425254 RepID=UPI0006D0FD1A|nr:tRNA pseudouridine(38-40) synthase TruA [Cellulosilyticum ruminicola]